MSEKVKKDVAHYSGHRDRLRQRFLKSGADGFQDYELFEIVLFSALPRRDVKLIAKNLLKEFGSINAALSASVVDLKKVKGISDNSAVLLKTVYSLTQRMLKNDIEKKPILGSWQKLIDYCYVSMANEKREQFRILFLNRKNQLMADEVQQVGTVDHTPVYPREIVKRALELGATAMILVHNHPSGDHTPSDSDLDMTEEVIKAAAALDIQVHDHLIISKNGYTSFKSLGLMSFAA